MFLSQEGGIGSTLIVPGRIEIEIIITDNDE